MVDFRRPGLVTIILATAKSIESISNIELKDKYLFEVDGNNLFTDTRVSLQQSTS